MSKPPAFQFYAADFLVGTAAMSNEEVGIYIRLLAYQWDQGGLPSDPKSLRSLCRTRAVIPPLVLTKFAQCSDGLLRNERLEKERVKQLEFRETRALSGALGGKAKAEALARAKQVPEDASFSLVANTVANAQQNVALQSSSSSSPSGSSTHIARVNFAIPASEAEAVEFAARAGVPMDFAKELYHQCEGRGWVDGSGQAIQMWSSYAKGRYLKEAFKQQQGQGRTSGAKAPTIFELKAQKEAKEEMARQIKNRHCSDVAMGETWSNPEEHKKYKTLRREINDINERMAKCH